MTDSLILMAFLIAIVFLSGALLAVTPWLMKKSECFTVTIPESAQEDARFRTFRMRYSAIVLAVTIVCAAAMGVLAWACSNETVAVAGMGSRDIVFAAIVIVATLVPMVASFVLMLHYRKRICAIKESEGWRSENSQAAAVVGFEDIPQPPSLAWNLVYVPIVLITLAIGLAIYPSAPDMVPMHMDFAGNVNSWAPKGPELIAFPVLLEVFMAACFILSHWVTLRSKKDIDPARPFISAYAYGAFARAECLLLLIGGATLTAVLGVPMILMMAELVSPVATIGLIVLVVLAFTVAAAAVSLVYGQSGSRLFKRLDASGGMITDNDEHWKAGIFYWNKDDASLILPKRFGIGWTMNWARPAAWLIVGGFTLASIAFVAACIFLV